MRKRSGRRRRRQREQARRTSTSASTYGRRGIQQWMPPLPYVEQPDNDQMLLIAHSSFFSPSSTFSRAGDLRTMFVYKAGNYAICSVRAFA